LTAQQALILDAYKRRKLRKTRQEKATQAREHLLDFIEYTKPNYEAGWFHRKVCQVFEQFLQDVRDNKRPRVILSAPPQHGKSEIVSRRFPVWAQGKFPDLRFVCSSYNTDWAEALSTDRIRCFTAPEFGEVFPDCKIRKAKAEMIETQAGGFQLAKGVGAGITGRSADIGIIDDPIKGYAEATSETYRESLHNWYRTDFYSRLQKGAGVIAMMTRWHEADLIGRLIDEMSDGGDQWQIYNFPAIAEEDEEFRKEGEPLSVERYDIRALNAIKVVQGSYAWNALYQGHPAPAEGLMLRRDYWRYYGKRPDEKPDVPEFEIIVVSIDAAFKAAADSDHVAMHVWGFVGSRGYLLDRTCERMGYTATKAEASRLALKWKAHSLLIEDTANGPAIIEELGRSLGGKVSIIPIQPQGGKVARAWPFSADLEAGNALLPEFEHFSGEIVDYAAKFPNTPMDHDIDAITQAFAWRRENVHGLFAYYENQARQSKQPGVSQSLAKVETPSESEQCGNCASVAIRKDGSARQCNQCGHFWVIPGGDDEPTGFDGRF
jgi:predicted phage terminase large subunit-like protein